VLAKRFIAALSLLLFLAFTTSQAAPPPPKKKPAPRPAVHHPVYHHPNFYPRLGTPFVPIFVPVYAYLPYYYPYTARNPAMYPNAMANNNPPSDSQGGFDKEMVIPLASNATVTALQVRPSGVSAYLPSGFDALKADQVVTVLVKPAEAGDKPVSWTLTGKVILAEDGTPRQLTLKARTTTAQGQFDPANKVISAITIRTPATNNAAAQK
jgi:hypothetical protein